MKQFFKDIWDVLRGHGAEGAKWDVPEFARCVSLGAGGEIIQHQRHLYLGGEVCRRMCGASNPDYKPEPVAVPTEGA